MVLGALPPIQYLLLAIALGAIVGLENEYRMRQGAKIYLGLRTCIFVALLGYVFALLYFATGSSSVIIAAAAVITVIATAVYMGKTFIMKSPGATTYVSGMLLFFIGVLTGLGYFEYAIVLAIIVAAVSFYKREFLFFIGKLKRTEMIATINLLIIAFVILPLLPDSFIGPYQFFNPFEFWFIVAIVGSIFFLQYAVLKATRYGLQIYSLIGSVVTGTAVTYSMLNMGRGIKKKSEAVFYNIMFSTNLPMILIQALVFVYVITLSWKVVYDFLPVLMVSVASVVAIGFYGRKNMNLKMKESKNPFPIKSILFFAAIFFVIFTVSRLVSLFAPQYLIVTMFVSALANVAGSAFSLGLLSLHGYITPAYTAFLLGLVVGAGILEKGFLAFLSKDKELRNRLFKYSMVVGALTIITAVVAYGI